MDETKDILSKYKSIAMIGVSNEIHAKIWI